MRFLHSTILLVLITLTTTNAFALPRAENSTNLPDSKCLNSTDGSCESSWDRVPTFVKAIIFIAAFLALGVLAWAFQKLKAIIKGVLPSWMRSRTNVQPPTQMELNMCWERYGGKDGEGKPRAASQRELLKLWKERGQGMRFELLAEGGRGERAPFIVPGAPHV